MLRVTVHNLAHTAVLRCEGRLVRGEEASLLCTAIHRPERDLVIDLGGITAIDAAGIGALVSLQAAGIYLKLMNPTEPVRTVLRLAGLDSVFEFCEEQSLEEPEAPSRDFGLGTGRLAFVN